jgi:CheY-like chemotaxis protein
VVEDDPQMRSLLVRLLRSLARDLRVLEAADGEAGLQQIRASRPDAVVLDLLMPSQDGYAVLRALRDDPALRGLPVVVVSARGPKEEVLVDVVGITRHDGIPVGEATAYLKASLDAVRHPSRAMDHGRSTDETARALPAGSRG